MDVGFRDSKLARECSDDSSRRRAFGDARAKKVKGRLSLLLGASNLEELRNAPGRFHELHRDRTGQFAADLDGPYRLIFEPALAAEDHATHAEGFVWAKITRVTIIEIEDYHD